MKRTIAVALCSGIMALACTTGAEQAAEAGRRAQEPRGLAVPADSGAVLVLAPLPGTRLEGETRFEARLPDREADDYLMCWRVDSGPLHPMRTEEPTKIARADVSGWGWRGTGPYIVTFVAEDDAGSLLARQSLHVFVESPPDSADAPDPTLYEHDRCAGQ